MTRAGDLIARAQHVQPILRRRALDGPRECFEYREHHPVRTAVRTTSLWLSSKFISYHDDNAAFGRSAHSPAAAVMVQAVHEIPLSALNDDGINAFELANAVRSADRCFSIIKQLYSLLMRILTIFASFTGVKPRVTAFAAFDTQPRRVEPSIRPPAFSEQLFTPPALSMLLAEELPAPEPPVRETPRASQKFYRKLEVADHETLSASQAGYVNCTTQTQEGMAFFNHRREIVLWKEHAVLKRSVADTFETAQARDDVQAAVTASTEAWNRVAPGNVTFQPAEAEEDASFVVTFAKDGGGKEVSAFFPTNYVPGHSSVLVFSNALTPENRSNLSNLLYHEFGHVLGFLHGFVLEDEACFESGIQTSKDPLSVMSYAYPPRISVQDISRSRAVYDRFAGYGKFEFGDHRRRRYELQVRRIEVAS